MTKEEIAEEARKLAAKLGVDRTIKFNKVSKKGDKPVFLQAFGYEDEKIEIRSSKSCQILEVYRKLGSGSLDLKLKSQGCGGIINFTDDPQLFSYITRRLNEPEIGSTKNNVGFSKAK